MRLKSLSLLFLILLAACGGAATAEPSASPTSAPTAKPTLTPLPAEPLVMLILPADMNAEESALYQAVVYDLARAGNYRFQVRNNLSLQEANEPGLSIVIALPPDIGLVALAAAAPQTRFLAVNIPGLSAGGNLSVINSADRADYAAFTSGYIGALLSEDWRTGILTQKGGESSLLSQKAFVNGNTFYCGLCNTAFPPYYSYPIMIEVPADIPASETVAYGNVLLDYKVEVAFIEASVQNTELLSSLASNGVWLIGTSTPKDSSVLSHWIATIQPDYVRAMQTAWADLESGVFGVDYPAPLALTNINEEILTPGKQRLALDLLEKLLGGYIDSGVTP